MKNKNYLLRLTDGSFCLGRGLPLEEDNTLALVHIWSRNDLPYMWSVIDIASGLFVAKGKTKKKCLENYYKKDEALVDIGGIKSRIISCRQGEKYKDRCDELETEQCIWRESGYVL